MIELRLLMFYIYSNISIENKTGGIYKLGSNKSLTKEFGKARFQKVFTEISEKFIRR